MGTIQAALLETDTSDSLDRGSDDDGGRARAVTAAALVAEAKQRGENLSVDQVARELERGDALLVDLREPEDRVQHGVIPGAVHAARGMLEFYADPTSPYHRPEFDQTRRVVL